MTAHAHPTYALPGSLFIVLTGNINDGKTWQMTRLLTAEDESGAPLVAPVLVLIAESSGEGTAGEFLAAADRCLVWGCVTCDDALDALATVFPEGRPPLTLGEARAALHALKVAEAKAAGMPAPPAPVVTQNDRMPIRAVACDSISTLYAGQMAHVGNAGRKPGAGAPPAKAGKDISTNTRDQAKLAAPRCVALIDRLSGLTQRHRGTLVVVACHVRPQSATMKVGEGPSAEVITNVVGWAPSLGSPKDVQAGILATGFAATWQHLAAKANIIWHLFTVLPDFRRIGKDQINAGPAMPTFGAITARGYYADLGLVAWVKRQGGDGWLGAFDALPPYWHESAPWDGGHQWPSPDLGAVLQHCVASWRERMRQSC